MIEVKTTTSELGDRFFMSNNQVQLVDSYFTLCKVYTFILIDGNDSFHCNTSILPGVRDFQGLQIGVYIDPQAHRGRIFAFAEHSWTVTAV